MPFYNFQVRTASHVMVTEGAELADATAARVEAARRIGLLLAQHAEAIWIDQDWQMDVTDGAGLILYMINVSTMKMSGP